jgi:hypothetical protein
MATNPAVFSPLSPLAVPLYQTLADAIPIDTSKPGDAISHLAIVLLSLFAQMERTYAAERAAHARAVREEKGQRTGRKIAANTEQHLEWARHLRDVDHLTMAEITAKTGIPRTSLYRHFNRMDDRTVSAGQQPHQLPEAESVAVPNRAWHRPDPTTTAGRARPTVALVSSPLMLLPDHDGYAV